MDRAISITGFVAPATIQHILTLQESTGICKRGEHDAQGIERINVEWRAALFTDKCKSKEQTSDTALEFATSYRAYLDSQ